MYNVCIRHYSHEVLGNLTKIKCYIEDRNMRKWVKNLPKALKANITCHPPPPLAFMKLSTLHSIWDLNSWKHFDTHHTSPFFTSCQKIKRVHEGDGKILGVFPPSTLIYILKTLWKYFLVFWWFSTCNLKQ